MPCVCLFKFFFLQSQIPPEFNFNASFLALQGSACTVFSPHAGGPSSRTLACGWFSKHPKRKLMQPRLWANMSQHWDMNIEIKKKKNSRQSAGHYPLLLLACWSYWAVSLQTYRFCACLSSCRAWSFGKCACLMLAVWCDALWQAQASLGATCPSRVGGGGVSPVGVPMMLAASLNAGQPLADPWCITVVAFLLRNRNKGWGLGGFWGGLHFPFLFVLLGKLNLRETRVSEESVDGADTSRRRVFHQIGRNLERVWTRCAQKNYLTLTITIIFTPSSRISTIMILNDIKNTHLNTQT